MSATGDLDSSRTGLIYFFTFQRHTAFLPLRYLYQECNYLIKDHPKVEPLQCFVKECPANRNCAEAIARRVNYLFEEVIPQVEQLFVYFNYRNSSFVRNGERIPSLGAVLFHRDFRTPRLLILNRWGFNKCKDEGVTYQWRPTMEFLTMGSQPGVIPVENLIHKP